MGRTLISPSFSARLLLIMAFGEGKGVVVHYSTTHSSSSQVSPQSSVSINTTFSKNTLPSAGRLGLFSSAVCRHQWALERRAACVRRLRLGSRLKRCVLGRPAGTTSNCLDTHGEALKSGRGILREKAERGNGFNKALRASWEFRPSRNVFFLATEQ